MLAELARRSMAKSINNAILSKIKTNEEGLFNGQPHLSEVCSEFLEASSQALKYLNDECVMLLPELQANIKEHKYVIVQAVRIMCFYETSNNFDPEDLEDVEFLKDDLKWKLEQGEMAAI